MHGLPARADHARQHEQSQQVRRAVRARAAAEDERREGDGVPRERARRVVPDRLGELAHDEVALVEGEHKVEEEVDAEPHVRREVTLPPPRRRRSRQMRGRAASRSRRRRATTRRWPRSRPARERRAIANRARARDRGRTIGTGARGTSGSRAGAGAAMSAKRKAGRVAPRAAHGRVARGSQSWSSLRYVAAHAREEPILGLM